MPRFVASLFAVPSSEEVVERIYFDAEDDEAAKTAAGRLTSESRPKLRLDADEPDGLRFVTFAALLPPG